MGFVSSFGMLMVFSVALARAVYARTKYVLLDDPLSAVVSITYLSVHMLPSYL
jgi:ABC-type nitrate/sulfonate/bicarbonate transport system ATPase subunit